VLIPFLSNLGEKHRQQLLVSLGNTLLRRIGVYHGKDCFQLVNVLYDQLPKSHDERPTEDACVLLLNDIAERGMLSREAFLSTKVSICNRRKGDSLRRGDVRRTKFARRQFEITE